MSYELKHTIEGKAKLVAFNPQDNTSLLSVSQIKKSQWIHEDMVYLWKEVDKRWDRVKEFKPNMVINQLSFSPDGNTIAFCNQKPCVCIYHLKGEYWLKDDIIEITSTIKQICFDITGRLIVATDTNILIGTNQEFTQPSPICDMIKDVYKKEDFEKIKVLCDIMLRDPLDVTLAALQKAQAEYKALDAKGGKRTRRYKKRGKGYKQ